MRKFDCIIWANDFSQNQGEGILARKFLRDYIKLNPKEIIKVKTFHQEFFVNKKLFKKKIILKKNFFYNYFTFIYGIYHLYSNRKKKIIYLNYLPLWNFLLFLFLPRKVILGPITGGVQVNNFNNLENILRKVLFPIFYRISLFIIYKKYKKVIFSTFLLKRYVKKNYISSCLFGYVYNIFLTKKKFNIKVNNKKKFDVVFYNRNYSSKRSKHIQNILNYMANKIKVCVIGDKYINKNFYNYGYVNHNQALRLIGKSKLAFGSGENILSLFAIDSYNCGTKLIYDKQLLSENFISKINSISIKFDHILSSSSIISKSLLDYNFKLDTNFSNFLKNKKKEINCFLKDYL